MKSQTIQNCRFHEENSLYTLVSPTKDFPLLVKDSKGRELTASSGDIVVLVGRAMRDFWLQDQPEKQVSVPFNEQGATFLQ